MKKYNIMGYKMVKLEDICHTLRKVRNDAEWFYREDIGDKKDVAIETCERIIRRIFIEEIREATTQEEIDAIIEMKGDFIVAKRDRKKSILFFSEWNDGNAVITSMAHRSMHFDYESKAHEVAESLIKTLGEGWIVIDTCQAEYEDNKRMLDKILGDEGDI